MSIILARLIEDEKSSLLIEAAMQYENSLNGYVTGKSLINYLKGHISDSNLESILYELEILKAIEFDPETGQKGFMNYSFRVRPYELQEVFHNTRITARILQELDIYEEKDTFKLVATLPADPDFAGIDIPGIHPLFPALHELIVLADEDLIIVNPFFEIKGMNDLFNALLASAGRGTKIRIISRDLKKRDKPNYKVLMELHKKAKLKNLEEKFKYYEYQADNVSESPPEFTIHAKIILSDNKAAYIGSSNLTRYGLGKYLEVGVVIRGGCVNSIKTVIDRLMTSKTMEEITL